MRSHQVLQLLRAFESRNVTALDSSDCSPIVWERAQGVHVWDADGKKYLDLTAAFGVAAAGHANPRVIKAGQRQMARLLHAMGDVHPHARKAELARELSRITFERWGKGSVPKSKGPASTAKAAQPSGKTIFCNSGFEAVEAALKTAMLATGNAGVIAFEGAYHGLGYGALNATHRDFFRSPFQSQLSGFARFVAFPANHGLPRQRGEVSLDSIEQAIRQLFRKGEIGAILVEPVQGRAGIHVPPSSFLPLLRRLCDEHGALLVLDEICTGFGRTGRWFACEHSQTIPDVICLGKALTGGFPLSACVGKAEVMDMAWPLSKGEAIHTSTFLGHPVGCAMALAQIAEIREQRLVQKSARLGKFLLKSLSSLHPPAGLLLSARGLGLMAGLELRFSDGSAATAPALKIINSMLRRGVILLPEGEHSNVIGFTPPLTITEPLLEETLRQLGEELR